ncbi:hypothetical protein OUZ56_006502 [Daphnia magna]|uniref:Uncharacterized protein n=1 Tax=Daphnia magna TaxID=35525 RepID=A0ABQ9YVU5_9CRUS|nr:hypothetical protein OUZ56_006502 [Daphnia magna]
MSSSENLLAPIWQLLGEPLFCSVSGIVLHMLQSFQWRWLVPYIPLLDTVRKRDEEALET